MLVGQVGFNRTVLHVTGGIGQTHRKEYVGGTGRIPYHLSYMGQVG